MAVTATLKHWSACGRLSSKQSTDGADGRLLACRIELTGRTEIHDHLLISTEHLLAEAQAAALGFGDAVAWIERVVVSTEPVLDPADSPAARTRWVELHRMLGDAAADPELLGQLDADLSELARKLPADVRGEIEDAALRSAVQADYPALITARPGLPQCTPYGAGGVSHANSAT